MATNKAFWSNVLPSMAAFAFSGLYTIVDGFFIGQNIGDYGIAAVNIAYPITALIQAVGTGIGMAGAIWIAISVGENDEHKKNKFLGNTFVLLALFSLCTTVARRFFTVRCCHFSARRAQFFSMPPTICASLCGVQPFNFAA